jgi:O-acetyl-ADP-ribose deacetylase (regulator of RNase III)
VAFPLISSGIYRWPKPDAVARALTAVEESPPTMVEVVRLVLFDEETRRIAATVLERRR